MPDANDHELLERYEGVRLDHVNKEFWRGLLAQELRLSRCEECGHWHHRPKPVCPSCWSKRVVATPVSGTGTIHLLILLHQGPPADGVDYSTPHPVVTVELDEQPGLRFTSTVIGTANDDLAIGQRVELAWTERDGRPYPVFQLASDQSPQQGAAA
jgi:uncharacterized OB-fold protein